METVALNNTLDQIDLTDTFRTFHPEYIIFLSANGTLSKIDYMLSHKTNLKECKKTKIIRSIFSKH